MLMEATRPNGKLYRSRKGWCSIFFDGDDNEWGTPAVLVLRTDDYATAEKIAQLMMLKNDSELELEEGTPGWFRESIRHGEPEWVSDTARGAPGWYFQAVY